MIVKEWTADRKMALCLCGPLGGVLVLSQFEKLV